ncbi:HopJ type III effector protein [Aestuariirhabdus sp. Z084]|uniref:HopJ type III effector protein n=1 Tax=Aestuariirhabdus haliotis TaxID=2918751 RepID=UPI00201B403A|nr:HopJ type III effector protein [Aestuariirhabdus haliotis]MCL6414037.1 HopJ type III effector protein [Aestuariirhabdus haliotis]MCL6417970.1 HopJ type III effector protein [Aestuariirhabdus haliotis]
MQDLLEKLRTAPQTVSFKEVQDQIERDYEYQPTAFSNGLGSDALSNAAGTNEGSCRIFAFARLNQLTEAQTLACFGDYYRVDVLENPQGEDHGNIRRFMRDGWPGIAFEGTALTKK